LSPNIVRTKPSRRAGLTLIEVLLALAILGAAAGVLMAAASRCLAVVKVAKNYYEARRILDIGEIEHPLLVVKELGKDKAVNLDVSPIQYPKGFTFTRVSERSGAHKDLMIVRDRVSWATRGKDSYEEVTTYLYYTNEVSDL